MNPPDWLASRPFAGLALALAALGSQPADASTSALQSDDPPRISNGTLAQECSFPSIVCMGSGSCGCTGTLVHPQLVLYAAHCGEHSEITLGEAGSSGRTIAIKTSKVNPDYDIGDADNHVQIAIDWAFAVLDEPVMDVPLTPAIYGCEAEMVVQEGGEIFQIGFGSPNSGTKYWKANTIRKLYDGVIETAGGGVACPGDSGGPLLMRMPDMSWRTVGITSTLVPQLDDCGQDQGYNNYSRIRHDMIAWVESESGTDITPCFTIDGVFEPTPECTNFFAGEATDSATWDDQCAGIARVVENTLCTPSDSENPSVTISAPSDGTHVDLGETLSVQAEAQDNVAVTSVVLQLDGQALDSLSASPYVWHLEDLEAGDHELVALASDAAGNVGESMKVSIVVGDSTTSGDETDASTSSTDASSDPSGSDESGDGSTSTATESDATTSGDDDDDDDDDDTNDDDDDDAQGDSSTSTATCACTTTAPKGNTTCWLLAVGLLAYSRRRSTRASTN